MRCEGMVRHGGIMTIGRPFWKQCEKDAIVLVKVKQTSGGFGHEITEGEFPACLDCWKRAKETEGIEIISVEPVSDKDENNEKGKE